MCENSDLHRVWYCVKDIIIIQIKLFILFPIIITER